MLWSATECIDRGFPARVGTRLSETFTHVMMNDFQVKETEGQLRAAQRVREGDGSAGVNVYTGLREK